MKNLQTVIALSLLFFFALQGCKKECKFSCIQNISITGTIFELGPLTMEVPNEGTYDGLGALPEKVKIGNYNGHMRSVIVSQTPPDVEGVIYLTLRHHFYDKKGNEFWTHDNATMTPIPGSQTQYRVYNELTIWSGIGDFECATGHLINDAIADFATNTLTVEKMSGTICWGCE